MHVQIRFGQTWDRHCVSELGQGRFRIRLRLNKVDEGLAFLPQQLDRVEAAGKHA